MSNTTLKDYPLDLTGTNPDNLITNEIKVATRPREQIFLTNLGPFYKDSLIIMKDGVELTPDKYKVYGYIPTASEHAGKNVVTLIEITDETLLGEFKLTYRIVGGKYTNKTGSILSYLNDMNLDEKTVDFLSILGRPKQYRPTDHKEDGRYLVGLEYITETLDTLTNLINHNDLDRITTLIDNLNDTKQLIENKVISLGTTLNNKMEAISDVQLDVTKEDLGLTDIEDLPLATSGDINAEPTTPNVYVTPQHVSELLTNTQNIKGSVAHGNATDVLNVLGRNNTRSGNEAWFYTTPQGNNDTTFYVDGTFKASSLGMHQAGGSGYYMDRGTGVPMHKIIGIDPDTETTGVLRRQHRRYLDNKLVFTPLHRNEVTPTGAVYLTLEDFHAYRGDNPVTLVDSWFYTHLGNVVIDGTTLNINGEAKLNTLQGVALGTIDVGSLESLNNTLSALTMVGTYLNHSEQVDRSGYAPNVILEATKTGDYSEFNISLTNEPIKVNPNLNFKYANGNNLVEVGVGKHLASGTTEILSKTNEVPTTDDKVTVYDTIAGTKPNFSPMDTWTHSAILSYLINKNQNRILQDGNVNNGYGVSAVETLDNKGESVSDLTGLTRTNSGPLSWNHSKNGLDGISDLMGNVWERLDGAYIENNHLYVAPDTGTHKESEYIDKGEFNVFDNLFEYGKENEVIHPPKFTDATGTYTFNDYWIYTTRFNTTHVVEKLTGKTVELFKPMEYGSILDIVIGHDKFSVIYTGGIITYMVRNIDLIVNSRIVKDADYETYGLLGDNIMYTKGNIITRFIDPSEQTTLTGEIHQISTKRNVQLLIAESKYWFLTQLPSGELIKEEIPGLAGLVTTHGIEQINVVDMGNYTNDKILVIQANTDTVISILNKDNTLNTEILTLSSVNDITYKNDLVYIADTDGTKIKTRVSSFDRHWDVSRRAELDSTISNVLWLPNGALLVETLNELYISYNGFYTYTKVKAKHIKEIYNKVYNKVGEVLQLSHGGYVAPNERSGLFGVDTNTLLDPIKPQYMGIEGTTTNSLVTTTIDPIVQDVQLIRDNLMLTTEYLQTLVYLTDLSTQTTKPILDIDASSIYGNLDMDPYSHQIAAMTNTKLYHSEDVGETFKEYPTVGTANGTFILNDCVMALTYDNIYVLVDGVLKSKPTTITYKSYHAIPTKNLVVAMTSDEISYLEYDVETDTIIETVLDVPVFAGGGSTIHPDKNGTKVAIIESFNHSPTKNVVVLDLHDQRTITTYSNQTTIPSRLYLSDTHLIAVRSVSGETASISATELTQSTMANYVEYPDVKVGIDTHGMVDPYTIQFLNNNDEILELDLNNPSQPMVNTGVVESSGMLVDRSKTLSSPTTKGLNQTVHSLYGFDDDLPRYETTTNQMLKDAKITTPTNGAKGYLKIGGSYNTPTANAFTLDATDDELATDDVGYRIKHTK